MKLSRYGFLVFVAALCSLSFSSVLAEETWKKGDTFDAIRYEDQHGSIKILDDSVRNVIFLADMDAKDSLHEVLEEKGQDYLDKHQAVVIADIHRMPYLVSVMFALPAMPRLFLHPASNPRSGTGRQVSAKAGAFDFDSPRGSKDSVDRVTTVRKVYAYGTGV